MSEDQKKSLAAFAEDKLSQLDAQHLRRSLTPTAPADAVRVMRQGQTLISFCANDYLGLAQDPRLAAAAQAAAGEFGTGSGASRLVAGDLPLNAALEQSLAELKGCAAARLFGSGYLANIGAIPALVGPGDLIVLDALSHSCMHAGARLSGAEIRPFAHNDTESAAAALADRDGFRHALLLTETVFSMDGDIAPLAALGALADATDSWLMTDDAHGLGVVPLDNPAVVQMGTLSKSAGSYGGYVCGPAAFVDLLTSRARSLVYTTGLPAAVLAASLEAVRIIAVEAWRGAAVCGHARRFAAQLDLPEPQSAIVPLIVGDAETALALSAHLQAQGFLVPAIRPPTVPPGTARLRITFSAAHETAQVDALAAAVKSFGAFA